MRRDYNGFYFTVKERRSILILLFLITVVWSLNYLFPSYDDIPRQRDKEYQMAIEAYLAKQAMANSEELEVPRFDVNLVTENELVSFGLSTKTAQTWIKFRNSINGFNSIEQLRKIYNLDSSWLIANQQAFIFSKSQDRKREKEELRQMRRDSFDPNLIEASTLSDWGFSEFAWRNLEKFRDKGGRFHRPEDVSQIFGITPEFFEKIRPLIKINPKNEPQPLILASSDSIVLREQRSEKVDPVEVNSATIYQWQLIPGIGPNYARRILRFRDALGGFVSIEQIGDTYGLPDSVFTKIQPYLTLTREVQKLSINRINKKELSSHPYISYKKAAILINYRENHGDLSAIGDLYKIQIFDSVEIQKLGPYLEFSSNHKEVDEAH